MISKRPHASRLKRNLLIIIIEEVKHDSSHQIYITLILYLHLRLIVCTKAGYLALHTLLTDFGLGQLLIFIEDLSLYTQQKQTKTWNTLNLLWFFLCLLSSLPS
jgi:hypothetical protein